MPTDQESTLFSYPGFDLDCITISGARYCGVPTIVLSTVPASATYQLRYSSFDSPILAKPKSATLTIGGLSAVFKVRRMFLDQSRRQVNSLPALYHDASLPWRATVSFIRTCAYCIRHSAADLVRQIRGVLLRQSTIARVLHDVVEHIPSVHVFQDEIDVLWILKPFNQAADVFLSSA
jgi:hypothetical protein